MSGTRESLAMPTLEARLHLHPRRVMDLLRHDRRLRRAAKAIPKPMPWEWAAPRLLPLLAGPYLGPDQLVTTVAEAGCALVYGVEVERTFLVLDHEVIGRWECSVDQVHEIAHRNLARRAARLSPEHLRHGILAGRLVRVLEFVPWASSLLLVPDQLIRVFGGQDQLFGAPKRESLLAFSLDTPVRVAAHILVDFEDNAAQPLLLPPFVLIDGKLRWEEDEDESAEEW
jgi:hypothetical protein